MRRWFNRVKFIEKTHDYFYKKNEEQLHREKIALEYDFVRSLAR